MTNDTLDQQTVFRVHTATFKFALAILPLIACTAIVALRNANFSIYRRLFVEDGLFEYLTSGFYFCAAAVALVIAITFWRHTRTILAAAYVFLAIGLFFIAGEEISWAQRILNIETPSALLEINTQQELNIHNLAPIQTALHAIYVIVGAYGSFLWALTMAPIARLRTLLTPYVVPRWYLASYFLPVFLLYCHLVAGSAESTWYQYRSPDQEPGEFIMSLGFLFFVLSNRYRQKLDLSLNMSMIFSVSWQRKSG